MRLVFLVTAVILGSILFTNCNIALAKDNLATSEGELNRLAPPKPINVGESRISPASPLYFIKYLRENFEMFLTGSNNALLYRQLEFGRRRLREIQTLIKEKRLDLVDRNLDRYRSSMKSVDELASKVPQEQLQVATTLSQYQDSLRHLYGEIADLPIKQKILLQVDRDRQFDSRLLNNLNVSPRPQILDYLNLRQEVICKFLEKEASATGMSGKIRGCL